MTFHAMRTRDRLIRALAQAFLAGTWTVDDMAQRGAIALEAQVHEMRELARLALRIFNEPPLGRSKALIEVLTRSRALRRLLARKPPLVVRRWFFPKPAMARPLPALAGLAVPSLTTAQEVAQLVGLTLHELAWFADLQRLNRSASSDQLRHYHYRWVAKRSGAYRLLEAPKARLKSAQRRILDAILNLIPLHDACHGHRRTRGVTTFVAPHQGKETVIALDFAEFFASVSEAQVRSIFAALGYPEQVAALLAGLCCTATPEAVLLARPRRQPVSSEAIEESFAQRMRLRSSHLAQGAPTSPALANLAAFRLDMRLQALARHFGADYTRYADDLAFSSSAGLGQAAATFVPIVAVIADEEGFALRFRKTRVMTSAQRQLLCGIVVNRESTLPRTELEALEATLFNCVRDGPMSQNRSHVADFRAYLRGRVAWVTQINARKGARLAELLAKIAWDEAGTQRK